MIRWKIIAFWLCLFAPSIHADVNQQLLSVYEHLSELQERVHKLETSTLNESQINELQQKLHQIQTAASPASPELESRIASLETKINQLISTRSEQQNTKQSFLGLSSDIILNHVWVLLCGVLVMMMQLGFTFLETGMIRTKNAVHTLTMNLMAYAIGMIAFWAVGFAFMYGGVGAIESLGIDAKWLSQTLAVNINGESYGVLGNKGFFLSGMITSPVLTFFFFQMVFATAANTICTGCLTERWRIKSFLLYSIPMAGFIYPLVGSWVWGGGWLHQLGFLDFAGSTVVHTAGGMVSLVGAKVLGPRLGKFTADRKSKSIPGHNLPYVFLGTFVLAIGWFGFNAGSTLRAGTDIGLIAVNTAIASATGAIAGFLLTMKLYGKPDPSFACNGMLAGLVAITAGCAYVSPWAAAVIGLIAGILVVYSASFVEEKLKLDDPVGAISVHGTNGIWGTFAVGIFAHPSLAPRAGIIYGESSQFMVQILGIISAVSVFLILGYIMFYIIGKISPNRASDEAQEAGLDDSEMGICAYHND